MTLIFQMWNGFVCTLLSKLEKVLLVKMVTKPLKHLGLNISKVDIETYQMR